MLAQSRPRKPAPPLAARGMWLRLGVGADAFGSALGDAVVGSIQRADSQKTPAISEGGDNALDRSTVRYGKPADMSQFTLPEIDPSLQFGDGVPSPVDRSNDVLLADASSAKDSPERQAYLARMNGMLDKQLSTSSYGNGDGAFRVDICGTSTYDCASDKSAVTDSGNGTGLNLAKRFGSGLLGAVEGVTLEPLRQARDLTLAGLSVGYNELIRSEGDPLWFPEMKSGMAASYANGASQARLLMQATPFIGVGVASYDLTTATMNQDWGTVAEMSGGLLGGFAIGKGVSKYGEYGVAFDDVSGPMSSQMGAINPRLVTPANQKSQLQTLRGGGDVHVGTVEEARALLNHMDELRPATQERLLPNPTGGLANGFKDPRGTYRGDLINKSDPTGPIHPGVQNFDHANYPHYNITLPNGNKAAIIIKGK